MISRKIKKIFDAFGAVDPKTRMKNFSPYEEKPIYGQILYLASSTLETRFGNFTGHMFQDLHSKDYCVVLTIGDIRGKAALHSRIHSSCITSETLRGLDSDDIQQLELALALIAQKKRGVLYYLIQEGRGVGFTAKARDRMLVQSVSGLSSHQAFELCGLHDDYRLYDSVYSINHLLGIHAPLHLLTNSPHKLDSIRKAGIKVRNSSPLLVTPYKHSVGYLKSKANKGHTLAVHDLKHESFFDYLTVKPKTIEPFIPYAVKHAERFIHTASYLIPIKPVHGALVIDRKHLSRFGKDIKKYLDTPGTDITSMTSILQKSKDGMMIVQLDRKKIKKIPALVDLLSVPYWFTLHAYYDVATSEDVIVLEYGNCRTSARPLVRIHSESLFNRFPLEDVENRDKFKKSIFEIVRHGAGLLLLLQNDGRGAGFGIFAMEKMLKEQKRIKNSKAAYEQLGISYDIRDYRSAALLLRNHLKKNNPEVSLLISSRKSFVTKPESVSAFKDVGIKVKDTILLSEIGLPKTSR